MPAITRIGDAHVTHCSTPHNATGSDNTFFNGIAVSREGDVTTSHKDDFCLPHTSTISKGSSFTFVNGKAIARIGDPSCTAVSQGSPDSFAG